MRQVNVTVIGTASCGGIRAATLRQLRSHRTKIGLFVRHEGTLAVGSELTVVGLNPLLDQANHARGQARCGIGLDTAWMVPVSMNTDHRR